MNSSLKVFSVIYNIKDMIEKGKNIKNIDKLNKFRYDKTKDFLRQFSKRLYNDIENGFFNYKDLKRYMIYQYIWNKKINVKNINKKNILNSKKVFTHDQLKLDQKMILKINEEIKLKSIEEFFKIQENVGESVLYQLIVKKHISPLFWIKYKKYFIESEYENKEHKYFRKICDYLN